MKFGLNTMLWTRPFTDEAIPYLKRIRDLGGSVAEITLSDLEPPFDPQKVRSVIADLGLELSVVCSFDKSRDLTETDDRRKNAIALVTAALKTCHAAGATILCGPLHASVRGQIHRDAKARSERLNRCVESYREITPVAEGLGIDIAIEPINRFESDFANTSAEMCELVRAIDSKRVGILLDTFHMNIEERSICAAIAGAADCLKHFHACENDRGAPGTGHVPWASVFHTLRQIRYDKLVVIETYNPDLPLLAERASIWRSLDVTQDLLGARGLEFLKQSAAG